MLILEDNYSHPVKGVKYIKESVIGAGGDKEAFRTWFGVTCHCTGEKPCIDNCECLLTFGRNYTNGLLVEEKLLSEISVYECSAFCSCSIKCFNKVVQRGPNPFLDIRKSEYKGLGVFSKRLILKGSFICEYAGEIIGKIEAVNRSKNLSTSKYLLTLREHYSDNITETFVDASTFGNIGRYINHSCEPNCVVIPVRTGCLIPKLALFACKEVQVDEEISYSYCPGGKELSKTKCYCRKENCTGLLPLDDCLTSLSQ